MSLKIIKQLTNQLQVLQELEAGNYILVSGLKQEGKVESGRLLKLDPESFSIVECYLGAFDKEYKFEKTRVLPDFTENDFVYSCKEGKWYDDIPEQGVICWVMEDKSRVDLIVNVLHDPYALKYINKCDNYWTYAEPLTKKELLTFNQNIT